jgi:hypothetical protein
MQQRRTALARAHLKIDTEKRAQNEVLLTKALSDLGVIAGEL